MTHLWEAIAPAWKIGTAVAGGLLVLTLSAGPRTLAWVRGPVTEIQEQVARHDTALAEFRVYIQTDSARWDRVLCHMEEQRKPEDEQSWERCER